MELRQLFVLHRKFGGASDVSRDSPTSGQKHRKRPNSDTPMPKGGIEVSIVYRTKRMQSTKC